MDQSDKFNKRKFGVFTSSQKQWFSSIPARVWFPGTAGVTPREESGVEYKHHQMLAKIPPHTHKNKISYFQLGLNLLP